MVSRDKHGNPIDPQWAIGMGHGLELLQRYIERPLLLAVSAIQQRCGCTFDGHGKHSPIVLHSVNSRSILCALGSQIRCPRRKAKWLLCREAFRIFRWLLSDAARRLWACNSTVNDPTPQPSLRYHRIFTRHWTRECRLPYSISSY
jgi:hypothetical protein